MSKVSGKLDLYGPYWKDKKFSGAKVRFLDDCPTIFIKMKKAKWQDIPISCQTWREFQTHTIWMISSSQYLEGFRHYFDLWVWTQDEHKKDYLRMANFFEKAAREAKQLEASFAKMHKRFTKQVSDDMIDILKFGHLTTTLPNSGSIIEDMTTLAKGVNTGVNPGDTPDDASGLTS